MGYLMERNPSKKKLIMKDNGFSLANPSFKIGFVYLLFRTPLILLKTAHWVYPLKSQHLFLLIIGFRSFTLRISKIVISSIRAFFEHLILSQ